MQCFPLVEHLRVVVGVTGGFSNKLVNKSNLKMAIYIIAYLSNFQNIFKYQTTLTQLLVQSCFQYFVMCLFAQFAFSVGMFHFDFFGGKKRICNTCLCGFASGAHPFIEILRHAARRSPFRFQLSSKVSFDLK